MAGEWRRDEWGEIATLEYGKSLRDYRSESGRYRVYGTNGPIGWHEEPLCTHPGVIVGRKGAYRGIHYSPGQFFVIDTAFYLEPKQEMALRWAYYCLLTYDINGMDSGSAIPSTSREAFYRLPVRVPPFKEQQAIACILGALDDKIELNRKMNRTLEDIARAIFKSWFVDFLPVRANMARTQTGDPARANPAGQQPPLPAPQSEAARQAGGLKPEIAGLFPDSFEDSELGEIPKGWLASNVGTHFRLTMGQSPPGSTYNEVGEGMPFYQGRTDFGFRYPTRRVFCTAPTRFAEPGDALVSVRAPVGDVNMANERCAVGRGVAAIRHCSGSRSFTYYSMHHLGDHFSKFEAEGTVFGCINKADFKRLPFTVPSPEALTAFDRVVSPLDDRIETSETQIAILAVLRDTLLPNLISGELRVPEAERIAGRCL